MSKQKNKLLIAMCALCVAFLGVIGALVGVLAASTQTVGTSFSVGYSIGDNIAMAIGANYKISDSPDFTNKDTVWFEGSSNSANVYEDKGLYRIDTIQTSDVGLLLSTDDISLANTSETCLISFIFQNNCDKTIAGKLTDNCEISTNDNIWINRGVAKLTLNENYTQEDLERAVLGLSQGTNFTLDEENSYSFTIEPGEVVAVSFFIFLGNPNYSAYYKSTAENGISFSFSQQI